MALTSMETKFCKLPLDFGALLSEDVENSRLASCTEIESIDQFIEMLIDTAPGGSTPLTRSSAVRFFILILRVSFRIPVGKGSFPTISPKPSPGTRSVLRM